jgi:hypothetical protein
MIMRSDGCSMRLRLLYNLQYDPASDRLKGTYFQAVEKQIYDIEFVRTK